MRIRFRTVCIVELRMLEFVFDDSATQTPVPQTVKELEDLVRAKNKPCTCDACNPRSRAKFKCIRWPHFTIALESRLTTNCFDNIVFAPPKLSSRRAWPVEGMPLVRTMIAYFDRPLTMLNDQQLAARATLIAWRNSRWEDILTTYPDPEGDALLPAHEMQHLWQTLNILFFGGPIPGISFRWKKLEKGVVGDATTSFSRHPVITMDPSPTAYEFGDYVILDFLSTLAHESIHAVLRYYPCLACRSGYRERRAGGYVRLFQTLARKLEEVIPRLLGGPVRLGRLESLLGELGGREWGARLKGRLPSSCDVENWGLVDVDTDVRNADVRRLVERMHAGREV
ncbi:hypothetical protein SLS60_001123 [Paraconiothyrium brasiliense]|uniref:SprT-like domain-containing protein n=1 Tax=Paraconiothyrium brasiliense TaxID=300254 RepID=A0ABR3S871_9PLEO